MLKGVKALFSPTGPTGMAGVSSFLGIKPGGGNIFSSIFGGGSSGSSASGAASGTDVAATTMSSFSGAIDNVATNFTSEMGSSVGSVSNLFGTSMGSVASTLGSLLGGGGSGGGGGGGGLLSSIFGAGGASGGGGMGSGGILDSLASAGAFREGGYTGSPVGSASGSLYSFSNAPHFAQGTPNTGNFAGGMPSVLHQNEAVIPLSRGRSIPVQFSGNGAMGHSQAPPSQHITFNVTAPDPDSFRRSQSQMATQAYGVGTRAARRNS